MKKLKRTDQLFKATRAWFYNFYSDPRNKNHLETASNVLGGPGYTHTWLMIFTNFFHSAPDSNNDKRWDQLLHHCGGWDADQRVRRILKRLKSTKHSRKAKAA